jgi:hypothetical protein
VNSLGSQHVDERELLLSKYESELTTLHQSQYREFREVPYYSLSIVKLSPSTGSSDRYPYYS